MSHTLIDDGHDHAPTPWQRDPQVEALIRDAGGDKVAYVMADGWLRDEIVKGLVDLSRGSPCPRSLDAVCPRPWSDSCNVISDASGRQILSLYSTRGDTWWEQDICHQITALVNGLNQPEG